MQIPVQQQPLAARVLHCILISRRNLTRFCLEGKSQDKSIGGGIEISGMITCEEETKSSQGDIVRVGEWAKVGKWSAMWENVKLFS